MKHITFYKICGMNVAVETSDPADWSTNGMGRSDHTKNKITLRAGMPHDLEGNTLIHEVIHMIADMNSLAVGSDEVAVSALANGLFAFLRDNSLPYFGGGKEEGDG